MSDQPVVKSPADWAFDGIDALVARCKRAEAERAAALSDAIRMTDEALRLVARCERAEADADRLAGRVANIPVTWMTVVDGKALRLHDEAVALR